MDLQQRRLVTECVVLLLPQFGRCTAPATVAQVIDLMDATLSKVVLTQVSAGRDRGREPDVAAAGGGRTQPSTCKCLGGRHSGRRGTEAKLSRCRPPHRLPCSSNPQLTMSGSPLALQRGGAVTPRAGPRCSSDSDVDLSAADSPNLEAMGFDFEVSLAPPAFDTLSSGQLSPGRAASSYGGASRRTSFSEAAAVAAADAQVEALKNRFVAVLEDKGWGHS